MKVKLNQIVIWQDCPGSNGSYSLGRVRGISPCGGYALLSFIRHPVPVASLCEGQEVGEFWRRYPKVTKNDWPKNNVDRSTGENLLIWVEEYKQRELFANAKAL